MELLKEIGEMALYDGARLKKFGQVAEYWPIPRGDFKSLPGILLANFSYILPQLDQASYPLRSLICESLGNLVVGLHEGVSSINCHRKTLRLTTNQMRAI